MALLNNPGWIQDPNSEGRLIGAVGDPGGGLPVRAAFETVGVAEVTLAQANLPVNATTHTHTYDTVPTPARWSADGNVANPAGELSGYVAQSEETTGATNVPGGDDESCEDDNGSKQLQKATFKRQVQFQSGQIPMWLAEKIMLAALHPVLSINGIELVMNERPAIESKSEQNSPFNLVSGLFEMADTSIITDSTGIVSAPRYVLSTKQNTILEL